jgi:hypothetical protein
MRNGGSPLFFGQTITSYSLVSVPRLMATGTIEPRCAQNAKRESLKSRHEPTMALVRFKIGAWSILSERAVARCLPRFPKRLLKDYVEACNVLPISPKASAALSRRCLQNILHKEGYKGRDLAVEIDLLLNEADPTKAIPQRLRTTIDLIRNFGNFSAHPINDKTALQIIEVEPHEAGWCLEVLEECFQHFYVGPAIAEARKAALDEKLTAAGKLPSK